MGAGVRLSHTPPSTGFGLAKPVDLLLRDVALTATGLMALMDGLLTAGGVPTDAPRLGGWLADKRGVPEQRYASVLRRNYRR